MKCYENIGQENTLKHMKTRKNTCKNVFHMFYGQIAKTLSQDLWALSFKILKYFELKILKFRILTRCTPQCLTLPTDRPRGCQERKPRYSSMGGGEGELLLMVSWAVTE